ncbi:MAG TPA: methyltransferase domain-containing protein [Verrucomicrobia bacterium]|nr:methyltransferase domain-containing protein [Verrucomicrobiales bacterium]HIL53573.1 methyltransferase domain-containing protein [Verrucomicrobiota bacterium]
MKSTQLAHQLVSDRLEGSEVVVDATAGNGHDTLFLAEQVGVTGVVYSFDVQEEAIRMTRSRLEEAQISDRVIMCETGHENLDEVIRAPHLGNISAIMFNLGYLPGGDHSITTLKGTTLTALRKALECLRDGGFLTALCYPGHDEGLEESVEVLTFLESLDQAHFLTKNYRDASIPDNVPFLVSVQKS